ncbi:DUF7333 family protein [Haloarchaeobius iranensis]|uniref:Uncharacterized protein n=1 Tax=Haloarchaeobius iranensis TaxID=996166 RepID=A0A1G9V2L7_9EURY|nr:hypothetical protein [Haloarchaeobius iranensis]SDM66472.1 hypothetical protein SAMN05192554_105160 [Haloarchaeobius iranensis]
MELDQTKTAVAFLALIAVGTAALLAMQVMPMQTTLMMVTPSMLVFGLICLGIGVAHGEYRATR